MFLDTVSALSSLFSKVDNQVAVLICGTEIVPEIVIADLVVLVLQDCLNSRFVPFRFFQFTCNQYYFALLFAYSWRPFTGPSDHGSGI